MSNRRKKVMGGKVWAVQLSRKDEVSLEAAIYLLRTSAEIQFNVGDEPLVLALGTRANLAAVFAGEAG